MIKHVVMWRYRNKEDIEIARTRLEGMRGKVPTMLSLEVGVDINRSDAAYDLVLITTHEDWSMLEAYQADNLHCGIKAVLGKLDSERVVVDFEY